MRIQIFSARGETFVDWADYALLRDNIQHFLESGRPTQAFSALHRFEHAIDFGEAVIDAARLRGELWSACYQLRDLQVRDSAVSLRTHALLTSSPIPEERGTQLASVSGWHLPVRPSEARLLRQLRPLIAALLGATETATDGDILRVRASRDRKTPAVILQ